MGNIITSTLPGAFLPFPVCDVGMLWSLARLGKDLADAKNEHARVLQAGLCGEA